MGPLKGIRIIEIASIGPVPFAGMLLSDLGADIIRVDRTEPSGLGTHMPRPFRVPTRGRRSIALDLKRPEGRAILMQLIAGADVLMEGLRPGAMERLEAGPEACLALNPLLVYGRMTGWGREGAYAQMAGHDINYIALSGALHSIGPAAQAPTPPLNLVGDYGGGGLYLVTGILSALIERQTSGQGQVVDAAMVDGAVSLMANFFGRLAAGIWSEDRQSNVQDGGSHYYGAYETADGKFVSVGANEPKFYRTLLTRLGLADDPDFAQRQADRSAWPDLRRRMAEVFRTRTRAEWCAVFEGSDACFAPVLSMSEALTHPQLRERGSFVEIDGVPQPAPAPRFSRTQPEVQFPPVDPGADTDAVLAELGLPVDEIALLRAQDVVR